MQTGAVDVGAKGPASPRESRVQVLVVGLHAHPHATGHLRDLALGGSPGLGKDGSMAFTSVHAVEHEKNDGHTPRSMYEKATSIEAPQLRQCPRAKPEAKIQQRKYFWSQ